MHEKKAEQDGFFILNIQKQSGGSCEAFVMYWALSELL